MGTALCLQDLLLSTICPCLTPIFVVSAISLRQNPGEHYLGSTGSEIKGIQCPCMVGRSYHWLRCLWDAVLVFKYVSFKYAIGRSNRDVLDRSSLHRSWRYVTLLGWLAFSSWSFSHLSEFFSVLGLFFLSAVLAWFLQAFPILNTKDKRRKSITILGLVLMSFMLLVLLTTLFSASILVSISLEEIEIPEAQRGNIACFIDQSGSCTRCEEEENRCPEWSNADVTKILQNQTKASAALAAIFLTYAASNLRHAFNLRSHIMNYQIDYV